MDGVGPAVRTEGLVVGYGDVSVVHGVDLEVDAGEIVALLGPNGSGKTTTLLALAGELPVTAGSVTLFGEPAKGPLHRRAAAGLAFVPEERSVISGLSVRDNLLLASSDVEPVLDLFPELRPLLDRRAGLLSGGEQQMLTLGRALVRRPRVLLADELSMGLAPVVVERLFAALVDAARELGAAVLLVEQQARRALGVADRWYLLRGGRVLAAGDTGADAAHVEELYLADAAAADSANS